MSIQKYSLLLSVGLFMGIASGMDGDRETRETLALLLHGHKKCNNDTIRPKIQLKKEMCDLRDTMQAFAQANRPSSCTLDKDMESKRVEFGSTERGFEVLFATQVAQFQLRTLSRDPLFAGKNGEEIYGITLLLDLDEKPVIDQIAGVFGITEYGDKKHLAVQIKDKYASLSQ